MTVTKSLSLNQFELNPDTNNTTTTHLNVIETDMKPSQTN